MRSGVNLVLDSYKLMATYKRTFIMDSIDERRANFEYIDLLKRNKRIIGLGKCLCNETWSMKPQNMFEIFIILLI
jgi:hypothetical protein